MLATRIYLAPDCSEAICNQFLKFTSSSHLDLGHYISEKMHMWEVLLEVSLHLIIAEFIPCLKSTILLSMFLNRIIREMNVLILEILQRVEKAARPNVPILVKIALHSSIDRSQHRIHSHIEFPIIN